MIRKVDLGDGQLSVSIQGSGEPILLIHGYPLDRHMWDAIVPNLAGGFQVIAPDLRGFGQSTGFHETVAMQHFADDLERVLDDLAISLPVTLCGLSMGGYIAWQMWQRHRNPYRSLIMMDTRAVADSETQARARQQNAIHMLNRGMADIPDAMLPKLLSETTHQKRPELVSQVRQMMLRQSPHGAAAAQRGMAARPDVTALLPEIDLPVLVICGEHDVISTPEEMRQIAGDLPRGKFVSIANAGHLPPLENPAAVCQAIFEFCRETI